ncbi:hypothetical protein LJ737_07545 [Hymenobacter sp. 15J16-1T3B]|uniref:hypothetical protein n=1 Tax=Hymenobacter sp. 15J16-1T3B TaxID=2886941 RepID=UPI001D11B06E|nr:hypothetical protein [Hymenobacter sp. 15J16-1T3B]MCC3157087.1 hypothetical protein [Hymenobacter sp. 15J16-1T3B]
MPLLPANSTFVEEEYQDVLNRYSGFGIGLFPLINNQLPSVFNCLRFFRSMMHQTEDVYATYETTEKAFAIQLDPDIEVICLWNDDMQTEIGDWYEEPNAEALKFIITHLLGSPGAIPG